MARSDGIDECGALRAAKVFEGGRSAYDERLISYRGLHDLLICATLELAGAGGDRGQYTKAPGYASVSRNVSVCLPPPGAEGCTTCWWRCPRRSLLWLARRNQRLRVMFRKARLQKSIVRCSLA